MTTELYNFAELSNTADNFNIRVASDILHQTNHTYLFIMALNLTVYDVTTNGVPILEQLMNGTESVRVELDVELQKALAAMVTLDSLFSLVWNDYDSLVERVQQQKTLLKYHQPMTEKQNFYR